VKFVEIHKMKLIDEKDFNFKNQKMKLINKNKIHHSNKFNLFFSRPSLSKKD
jgi:hypothetical protein